MSEFKESLLQQRQKIDEKLQAIANKEREEEERREREAKVSKGMLTPLQYGVVREDIFWCSGDERIESYGFGTASDFLNGPQFARGDRMVLIKDSSDQLIWVPYAADGDYSGSEEDAGIPNNEMYNMIEIVTS